MKAKHKFIISESDCDTQLEMLRPEMASSSLTYVRCIYISCSDTRMFTLESLSEFWFWVPKFWAQIASRILWVSAPFVHHSTDVGVFRSTACNTLKTWVLNVEVCWAFTLKVCGGSAVLWLGTWLLEAAELWRISEHIQMSGGDQLIHARPFSPELRFFI